MLPDQIAKGGSEHASQAALFAFVVVAAMHGFELAWAWADGAKLPKWSGQDALPELRWFHAVPNGANYGDDERGSRITGGKMKAEGLRKGVWDTFLPVRRVWASGLYIEMKKPSLKSPKDKWTGCSDEQRSFGVFVQQQGFIAEVCYNWREAANVIQRFIEWKE